MQTLTQVRMGYCHSSRVLGFRVDVHVWLTLTTQMPGTMHGHTTQYYNTSTLQYGCLHAS
jgi:hypothetical protein